MGMAKAEQLRIATDLENGAYATTVGDLILGKDLSSDTTATQLFNKYTVYYAKVDISKDLYESIKQKDQVIQLIKQIKIKLLG